MAVVLRQGQGLYVFLKIEDKTEESGYVADRFGPLA
jgi:hypothetical protein